MKRVIILVFTVLMTFALVGSSFAFGKSKLSDVKDDISDVRKEIKANKSQMSDLEYQINQLTLESLEVKEDLDNAQSELSQIEAELTALNNKIDKQTNALNSRLKSMYMNDSMSFVSVLLTSDSISDFLINLDIVKRIYKNDSDLLKELKEEHKQVEIKEAEAEKQKDAVAAKKEALDAKTAALNAEKSKISAENKKLEAEEDQLNAQAAALSSELSGYSGGTYTGGAMQWPVPSCHHITSYFGYRMHPTLGYVKFHSGIDIAGGLKGGEAVVAANSGTVIQAGYKSGYGGYGKFVMINHGGGLVTLYAHNSSVTVSVGQTVSRGQQIAKIGSTGISTGNHCHFEVRKNGTAVNPMGYLK